MNAVRQCAVQPTPFAVMSLLCRICGNSADNKIHRAREMMFGMRDEFDYLECSECGTLQIVEVPDLKLYYPQNYYSFEAGREIEFAQSFKRRLAARAAGGYFVYKKNPVGKYLAEKKEWIRNDFPASLREYPLGLKFDSRILDFGCGSGRLLRILSYFGFRNLTGADAFIEKKISYPNGVQILKRSLNELEPFFDFIMLHHSFEHLPNPQETLRELYRLLARGKFCLIRIPLINFAWEKYGVNWVQLDPPRHLFLYTEKSFRLLAEQAGFTVEKIIYDSEAFQFWGSEQYLRDIPLNDARAFQGVIEESLFTAAQMTEWQRQAEQLNAAGKGDQACFYLKKS